MNIPYISSTWPWMKAFASSDSGSYGLPSVLNSPGFDQRVLEAELLVQAGLVDVHAEHADRADSRRTASRRLRRGGADPVRGGRHAAVRDGDDLLPLAARVVDALRELRRALHVAARRVAVDDDRRDVGLAIAASNSSAKRSVDVPPEYSANMLMRCEMTP
jgi:hypothetical protein